MKLFCSVLLVLALVGIGVRVNLPLADGNFIEYPLKGNQYAVIVVQTGGLSEAAAKSAAQTRAAEITVAKGKRYFRVVSEKSTQVIKNDQPFPNNRAFPQNMYQELIIEHDFGRESLARRDLPNSNVFPAYRLVFEMEGSKGPRDVDACKFTKCNLGS